MESVNLKKLASLLNLSTSTVSKALRDSHEISEKTKARVRKLSKELNYEPNPYAGSLRKASSKTIAVIVPEIANNFFVSAINSIQKTAQSKGYHTLIYISHENSLYEKELLNHLINGRVDGILISLSRDTTDVEHIKMLQGKGLPVVMFDRVMESLGTSTVTTDDFESSYQATKHLLSKGCKAIAHCMISEMLSIGNKRMEGYKKALADQRISFNPGLLVQCTGDRMADYAKIKEMIMEGKPDGVFAAVESYALLVYEVCKELNIKQPKDLKLITFSNSEMAHLLHPSLSTITQPAFEMGKEAALQLIRSIEKKKTFRPERIVIKSELIVRESTR